MPAIYLMKQGYGPNPLFNNHWGLLVSAGGTPSAKDLAGTFLHVHGSVAAGFAFEAKRGWTQITCEDPYRPFLIGEATPSSVSIDTSDLPMPEPDESEHGWILDPTPRTELEKALLRAPPPQPSLRSASVGNPSVIRGARARLQDCQEWIRMALPYAVEAGHLEITEDIDVEEVLNVKNQ
ncbi:hypothetical protein DXG03_009296 [Asterophora parasitica]|uniref:Uncharacterized protein n=1 Tax=Asterophora parasitica TaxID=117018 RepID=A0A9P7GAY2_9AGAR|nr:hypothetical protein DXG03_009296 [Asterophora parasitica]